MFHLLPQHVFSVPPSPLPVPYLNRAIRLSCHADGPTVAFHTARFMLPGLIASALIKPVDMVGEAMMRAAGLVICFFFLLSLADAMRMTPTSPCFQPSPSQMLSPSFQTRSSSWRYQSSRCWLRYRSSISSRPGKLGAHTLQAMAETAGNKDVPVVLVAGATGRVGRQVVDLLLSRSQDPSDQLPRMIVKAAVRDTEKAARVLPTDESLQVTKCDLGDATAVARSCKDVDAVIWCATGFSDASDSSLLNKLLGVAKLKLTPRQSIDIAGLSQIGQLLVSQANHPALPGPKVVMCSSAAVTRPTWTEEKKKSRSPQAESSAANPLCRIRGRGGYSHSSSQSSWNFGCEEVRIFVLNTRKVTLFRDGEEALRSSGVSYAIVRPCGLNDKWPNGRAVFSQGDIAVGRINRQDVAQLLVQALLEEAARGKTFECVALPGYPAPKSLTLQLSRLKADGDASVSNPEVLDAQYALLQQLVPGETLQPNQLAMGQTYEQLDAGQVGRLGERGQERPTLARTD
eukprot:742826-Hanusia_phi.AAC.2